MDDLTGGLFVIEIVLLIFFFISKRIYKKLKSDGWKYITYSLAILAVIELAILLAKLKL